MLNYVLTASLVLAVAATPASAALFTFEADPLAAQTPFASQTQGLTATFSATFSGAAAVDPGAFEISYNSTSGPLPLYRSLTGAFLTTALGSIDPSSPLTIRFSDAVTALSLNFALGDRTGSLALLTNAGGRATAAGTAPSGSRYAEGVLSFAGASFTSVTLQTSAPGLAIDNVNATAASAVPEPASFGLLGAGLFAAARTRPRRPQQTDGSPV